MDEELLRIIDLFDNEEVTTADKINPPENPYRDFMDRNPRAQGGRIGFDDGTSPMARFGNKAYLSRKDSPNIIKLKQLLNNLESGDNFSISDLSKKSGVNRKTISQYLKRDYPQLGLGTGSQTQRAALGQRAKDAADIEYKKLLDSGYLNDYKKKIQSTRSNADKSLLNKALAKKYFPNLSEVAAIGRIERANARIRKQFPNLTYVDAEQGKSYRKREERKSLYKPSEDEAKILRQQNAQKKILNKYFQKNPEKLLEKSKVKEMLDVKLVNGKLDFSPRYNNKKDYINLAKKGKLFDEFDITPIRSEKRNIQFPVNKNVGVGKFNQGFIKQVDAYYKKTKNSTDPSVLKNKQAISNYLNSVGIRVEVEGERIGAKILPAINRTTGELPNIKNTLNKLEIDNLSLNKYVPPKTKNISKFVSELDTSRTKLNAKIPGITELFEMAKSIPGDFKKKAYLKAGFKTLGIGVAPLVIYDTYNNYTQGKPILETLEQGIIGTDIIGGTKRFLALTPEERKARSVVKQDALQDLNLDMPMGFGFIEGPTPQTDLTLEEAQVKAAAGDERVKALEAQKNFQRATDRSNFFGNIKDKILGAPQSISFAGGGIAGLSGGIDEGPQRTSMNPDSQGLRSLRNRARNL